LKALFTLDPITTDISSTLYQSAPNIDWQSIKYVAKYAPDGSVSGHDYDYHLSDGTVNRGASPDRTSERALMEMTRNHWQTTQDLGLPRWYKMIVTVNRDGKFSVDFEYNDNYTDEDMMKRG
jgi:hypothetical protein